MTLREERQEKLEEAYIQFGDEMQDALERQAKYVSANLQMMFGGKALADPGGFVHAMVNAHGACLAWLLAEGYVTLTEKGLAPEEEQDVRRKAIEADEAEESVGSVKSTGRNPSAYL